MQEVYVINTSSCNPVVCNPVASPYMKYILRHQRLYRQHNLPQSVIFRETELPWTGFEPTMLCAPGECSTNWATEAARSASWAKSLVQSKPIKLQVCYIQNYVCSKPLYYMPFEQEITDLWCLWCRSPFQRSLNFSQFLMDFTCTGSAKLWQCL